MIILAYAALVICAGLTGFCVGGSMGDISVRKMYFELLIILFFAGFCQWGGNLAIHYLYSRTGSNTPVIVYCLVAVLFASLGFYGSRYMAWCEETMKSLRRT